MRKRSRARIGAWLLGALAAVLVSAPNALVAQSQLAPYYGKNLVHYNTFRWRIYTTDHFEIYYYPEVQQHLERVASYAESAYQQISADLKHDLAFKVPLIIFKTHAEFEQENVIPGAAQEGVGAFAEPTRNRMLLPIDSPSDLLYRLITHELTHIFEFDIVPQSLIRRNLPLWIDEGLSDYETGYWAPIDLMTVRDAAVSDNVPKMSELEGYGDFSNPRLIYNLGHAVFEYIESRWGKEGIRQFLFSLRKSAVGGADNAYDESFKQKPDDFDQGFERYLKERFKPFRDKERPADYGKNLAPDPKKGPFSNALSIEPSPSGDLLAVFTGNRNDQELDLIIVSAKDGSVIRNMTPGFDEKMGFENISIPGERWNTVPWVAWSPKGDRIAYIVRSKQYKTLIIQNVVSRKIEERLEAKMVNEPESPCFSPDGTKIAFAGLRNARNEIFVADLQTRQITQLTDDTFADFAPTYSPDGKSIVYISRISGNDKLFKLDIATKKKTQLTFGTHDDGAAKFVDADTIVFPSTATDPNQPIDPEVARNGNIYNIWTLNLKTGELQQFTDTVGANVSPVVLNNGDKAPRIAFVTYYKGEYGVHTLERKEPLHKAETSDFGAPGPVIDFQPPLNHTYVKTNERKKGTFEKLFLEGRPPVNVGVTNSGDIFGATEISFSDVLGDHRFSVFAASISQYRSLAFSYLSLARRLQWAVQGYDYTQFFYPYGAGVYYDPALAPYVSRSDAIGTSTMYGGSLFGIYPLDMYRRLEGSVAITHYGQSYNDPTLAAQAAAYQQLYYGRNLLTNGTLMPLSIAFVQETTVFREFGPLAGNTLQARYEIAPPVGGFIGRQTVDADARYYLRLSGTGLLALRFRPFTSWGDYPNFLYFGGNSEMRGYEYLEFNGQKGFFANAELRFPIVHAMLTPIGVMGGVRGVFFFNMGGAWWETSSNRGYDTRYKFWTNKPETVTPYNYVYDPNSGAYVPVAGDPVTVTGFRLRDGRASYGIGLETFALGFPIHFDWSWRTLFNHSWENVLFGPVQAEAWRKPR
ncbi:MAG: hypothetical protein ACM3NQ_01765, partial [Bacteroidales bacterium]